MELRRLPTRPPEHEDEAAEPRTYSSKQVGEFFDVKPGRLNPHPGLNDTAGVCTDDIVRMWQQWPLELPMFVKVILASMPVITSQIWMVEKLSRMASIEKGQESTAAKIAMTEFPDEAKAPATQARNWRVKDRDGVGVDQDGSSGNSLTAGTEGPASCGDAAVVLARLVTTLWPGLHEVTEPTVKSVFVYAVAQLVRKYSVLKLEVELRVLSLHVSKALVGRPTVQPTVRCIVVQQYLTV
ncbi:hypothetical protein JG688_00009570 [Phytophthora aleatoria]|uniref:Uncharacterized protein n=1 Tax=Phytophthora aleatoria TaxID=2496075 RepID=A0A8J5INZ7_9STRA|nr:hypothetical protein JG688_00009570 [Phytophthora aleatoria]